LILLKAGFFVLPDLAGLMRQHQNPINTRKDDDCNSEPDSIGGFPVFVWLEPSMVWYS
jgi:hypothetical protein